MNCRRMRRYISRDMDGELDGIEKQALLDHLEICPECKQDYENLSSIINTIEPPAAIPAPPYLFQGIRQAIYAQKHQPFIIGWLKPVFVPALFLALFLFSAVISGPLVQRITPKPDKTDSADLELTLSLTVFDDAPATSFSNIYNNMMTGERR